MSNKKPDFGAGRLFIKQRTDASGNDVASPKTFRVDCEAMSLDISQDHEDMVGDGVFLQSSERSRISLSGRISGLFSKALIGELAGISAPLSYSIKMHPPPPGGINAPEPACKIDSQSAGLDIMHDCGVTDASGIRLKAASDPIIGEYYFDTEEKSYHFPIGGTYFPYFLYADHSTPSSHIDILDSMQGECATFSLIYCCAWGGEITTIRLDKVAFPKISGISAKTGDFSAAFIDFVAILGIEDSSGFICDFKMLNQHLFNFDKYILKLNNNFPNGSTTIYDVTANATISNTGQLFTSAYLENGITTVNTNNGSLLATSLDVASSQFTSGMAIDFWWRPPTTFDVAVFFAWGQNNNLGNCPSLTYSSSFGKFFLSDGAVSIIDTSKALSSIAGKFNRITLFFTMNASGAINSGSLYVDKVLIGSGSIASPAYVSAGHPMAIMSGLGFPSVGHHAEFSISKGMSFPY